jgi:hypothetical protein
MRTGSSSYYCILWYGTILPKIVVLDTTRSVIRFTAVNGGMDLVIASQALHLLCNSQSKLYILPGHKSQVTSSHHERPSPQSHRE